MLDYMIHQDGSFDISGSQIALYGCYPSIDNCPLRPLRVEVSGEGASYFLPRGHIRVEFSRDEAGRIGISAQVFGLPGTHDMEIIGQSRMNRAERTYVQGFGMEGPSGLFDFGTDTPPSFGLTALAGDRSVLLLYAEDHTRYTAVFQSGRQRSLFGESVSFSAGFQLEGTAGERVDLPVLYMEEAEELAAGLRQCAERIAGRMGARSEMPPAFFWSSWYYQYETMDQSVLEDYLDGFRTAGFRDFQYIELDAGYTDHIGDWLLPNHRWPGGLRRAAETILDAGFQPGIWVAPFIVGDQSELYRQHPDWILREQDGSPVIRLRSYTEPKQWGNRDSNYFVLDTSHPDALAYLKTVFQTLRSWGFSFFKTDFMLWNMRDTSTVRRYNPALTSVEILRNTLSAIREAIGEDSYLLGCIAPFMPFIGYADGMRIAGDCGAQWAVPFGPMNLLRELPCDSYFNHIFWQNDPDAMMLRDFDTGLTAEECRSLALMQALSGGAVSTSDPVHLLSEDRKELLRLVRPAGNAVPEIPFSGTDRAELILLHRLPQGNLLYILNPTDSPVLSALRLPELLGGKNWYLYRYNWDGDSVSVRQDFFMETLPPHASTLLFLTEQPLAQKPRSLWDWS